MKLRWLFPAVGLLLLTAGARAQIGIYVNPMATHITDSTADNGVFTFLGPNNTSRTFGGVAIGGYYDLAHDPKFDIGVDVRDELEHGGGALLNSFLFGVRLDGKPANSRLRPYVQVSGGIGTSRGELSVQRANKAMVKVYGGLDYKLSPHVDFRTLEVGYGSVTVINSSLYGFPPVIPAAKLLSFSSGLVFRFGK